MELVLVIIRIFLFGVFFLAAVGKLLDLEGAAKAAKEFGTPDDLAPSIAVALPFAEIVFAYCFLFADWSWLGALGAAGLLLMFSIGMLIQIKKGNTPDCHCFGQVYSEPASKKSLIRNVVLFVLAAALLVRGQSGQGPDVAAGGQIMQTVLLLTIIALAVVIVAYLKRISNGQAQLLKRIDVLEAVSRAGGDVESEHEHVTHPEDSLPIGAPFPEFDLEQLKGGRVSLDALTQNAKPALAFFVSPTCDPCQAMLPEIEKWNAELRDRLSVVFFTTGERGANEEKFRSLEVPVLIQKNREVAEAVRAKWTPTALLIGPDGRIASHIAAGDVAIRKLVDGFKTAGSPNGNFFVAEENSFYTPPRIGERLPEFELADIDGRVRSHREVLGRRTVAMFWSPTCPFCRSMADSLRKWESERGADSPEMIVFTDGDAVSNREFGFRSPVIVDTARKASSSLGMWGTPSAVVVDENGTIVSETAVGEENIWALLGRTNGSTKG